MKYILFCAITTLALMNPLYAEISAEFKSESCECSSCQCNPCTCGTKCKCCKSDESCEYCFCACTQGGECSCNLDDTSCCTKNSL